MKLLNGLFAAFAGVGVLMLGVSALIFSASYVGFIPKPTFEFDPTGATRVEPAHQFTLVQLGTLRRDQFLVDGSTGRVWASGCEGDVKGADCSGQIAFSEMNVEGITSENVMAARLHKNYWDKTMQEAKDALEKFKQK